MLLAMALVAGCSRADRGALRVTPADAGAPVDVETMAFLSEARALHHEADLKEDSGDTRGARGEVQRIVEARRPHPGGAIPEVEEVLADAWARIAELDVRAGIRERPPARRKRGSPTQPGRRTSGGTCWRCKGIAEQARSAALADAGDAVGASKARTEAMRLLEEAVAVQDSVIAWALDGGSGEGGVP